MSEFVQVNCRMPNGIVLRIYEKAPQIAGEEPRHVPVGDPVELKSGANTIQKEFWEKWLAANSDNDVLINGLVSGPQQKKEEK